ncbi:MAG: alcohol dehydrogenase catalytic domain-containing protein [Planctomycetota bacterium]
MTAALMQKDKSFTFKKLGVMPPEPGMVRLEVAWCGVCGTDLHIYRGHMDTRVDFPQVIGHEASATVAAIGAGVEGFAVGDPVVVRPLDACDDCPACDRGYDHICSKLNFVGIDSAGAFQKYWTVRADLLHKLPEGMDLKLAAFVEPLAVACHDIRMSGLTSGERAVVLGGGPIGMLIALVAQADGAETILTEVNPLRLEMAESLGFTALNAAEVDVQEEVVNGTGGEGADVVFEVSGAAPSVEMMTRLARVRGRVVVVAIVPEPKPVDLFQVFWKELQIIGTRVYEEQDYDRAIELLATGAIDPTPLITGEFGLNQLGEAFDQLSTKPEHMKILIDCAN